MKNYQLIIFDWDGTIVDSVGHIVYSIQQSCVDLNQPVPTREQAQYVIGLGLNDALKHISPTASPDTVAQLLDRYRYHYINSESTVFPFPSVLEQIEQFYEQKILMAVATGKNRAGLDRALNTSSLKSFFSTTRCADESDPKPSPKMVLEILEELSFKPEDALVVGDTTHDILMAQQAKVDVVALAQGAHPEDQLRQANPTVLLSSISELSQWLGRDKLNELK
jgi:phosphoglycolate phosphatase